MNKLFWVKRAAAYFIFVIAFFTLVPVAFANDGVLGFTPEGVYPVTQSDISMAAEEIYIKLVDAARAEVTCRFDFKNYGNAQTVLMGFPAQLNETGELTPDEAFWVRNFTARDENGDLEVNLVDTIPNPPMKENGLEKYKKWYSFSVDFDKGEEKTLYHTYEVSFRYNSSGFVYMGYVLETGSLWKGPLGHSKVTFDFGDIPIHTLYAVYPNNFYRIEGNKLIWERRDFKPEYNLWVTCSQKYTDEWISQFDLTEEIMYIKEHIDFFGTPPEVIRENSEAYYEEYKTLIKSNPVRALYIKSVLGLPNGNEKPEITECSIEHHKEDYCLFSITATDPDMDIVSCNMIVGESKHSENDSDMGALLNPKENRYVFRKYLYRNAAEEGTFPVTFIVTDAYGNFDTKTMIFQTGANPGRESPSETDQEIPENETDEEQNTLPASNIQVEEPSKPEMTNLFQAENKTVGFLLAATVIALLLCIAVLLYLFIKRKNK